MTSAIPLAFSPFALVTTSFHPGSVSATCTPLRVSNLLFSSNEVSSKGLSPSAGIEKPRSNVLYFSKSPPTSTVTLLMMTGLLPPRAQNGKRAAMTSCRSMEAVRAFTLSFKLVVHVNKAPQPVAGTHLRDLARDGRQRLGGRAPEHKPAVDGLELPRDHGGNASFHELMAPAPSNGWNCCAFSPKLSWNVPLSCIPELMVTCIIGTASFLNEPLPIEPVRYVSPLDDASATDTLNATATASSSGEGDEKPAAVEGVDSEAIPTDTDEEKEKAEKEEKDKEAKYKQEEAEKAREEKEEKEREKPTIIVKKGNVFNFKKTWKSTWGDIKLDVKTLIEGLEATILPALPEDAEEGDEAPSNFQIPRNKGFTIKLQGQSQRSAIRFPKATDDIVQVEAERSRSQLPLPTINAPHCHPLAIYLHPNQWRSRARNTPAPTWTPESRDVSGTGITAAKSGGSGSGPGSGSASKADIVVVIVVIIDFGNRGAADCPPGHRHRLRERRRCPALDRPEVSARHRFQPSLNLAYYSGSGNGPFGIGWHLNLSKIERKVSTRLPTYLDDQQHGGDTDVFVLSEAEDLVPWQPKGEPSDTVVDGFCVRAYRPRVEREFSLRVKRHTSISDPGHVYWRTIFGDNMIRIFGRDESSQILETPDPGSQGGKRVFAWLLCESYDAYGNAMAYTYKSENQDELDKLEAGRQAVKLARHSTAHARAKYLKSDSFSACRSGFEIRSHRLCSRVLMFHHFPDELALDDCLVTSTTFVYEENPAGLFLSFVLRSGRALDQNTNQYTSENLAPLKFSYSKTKDMETIPLESLSPTCLQGLPVAESETVTRWIDLDSEGAPELLVQINGSWCFQRNETALNSTGQSEPESESESDLGSESDYDVRRYRQVRAHPPTPTHSKCPRLPEPNTSRTLTERLPDRECGWTLSQQFPAILNKSIGYKTSRRLDLTGDSLWDVLVMLMGNDQTEVYLADMSGDGLQYIVEVSNGKITYWSNHGYGRFGGAITMCGSPIFEDGGLFSFERVQLVDMDGSGTTGILYLFPNGGATVHLNRSGNTWSDAILIQQLPRLDELSSVFALDLLGKGTSCLCWVKPEGSSADKLVIHYLDLTAGGKPNLLASFENGLGLETRISYRPSTHFFLKNERSNNPWRMKLAFPVHVVARVVDKDQFSLSKQTTKYAYHDGYFDMHEREFWGFGMVESWYREETRLSSTGASKSSVAAPTRHTKLWYHTGAAEVALTPENAFGKAFIATDLPAVTGFSARREAFRSLRGLQFRTEVYRLDGSPKAAVPYSVREEVYEITPLQQQDPYVKFTGVTRVAFRENVSLWHERDRSDPRIGQDMVLERSDFGDVTRQLIIRHGCNKKLARIGNYQRNARVKRSGLHPKLVSPITSAQTSHSRNPELPRPGGPTLLASAPFGTLLSFRAAQNDPIPLLTSLGTNGLLSPARVFRGKESRIYYHPASLTRDIPLPLGEIECFSVVDREFNLGMSKYGCNAVYGSSGEKLMSLTLRSLVAEGGHVDLDKNQCIWAP
ncbi:virulence plasmid 65kDa B protein-domain-containing protein [Apodospora peruviana]|uniref:Virulence plasmid 65kDa B protein-domain-containing protein n=1 Tax=Apodospora peruviana TaxID=516989 RepID=A0AAE0I6Q0_9PEZI|nr:virulence plasmid 65kDa B protein-domain-containing protein [Apodospora peruviana]